MQPLKDVRCRHHYLSRIVRKPDFCLCENKGAFSAFVFATRIVQFLFYLNPKLQASSSFLSLYRPICVGPGRKPRRPVFSRRGSFHVHNSSILSFLPLQYAELETILGDSERARAIFELAIAQPKLDMPEVLWKAYIDFEIEQEEYNNTRNLYRRLLKRTQHVKVGRGPKIVKCCMLKFHETCLYFWITMLPSLIARRWVGRQDSMMAPT